MSATGALPIWLTIIQPRVGRLSDIEYLSIKEFNGKLVTGEGSTSATGDLVVKTATGGKDMYVGSVKIIAKRTNAAVGVRNAEIVLKANGIIKETASIAVHSGSGEGYDSTIVYDFVWKGKVAATQIIKLEVISIDTNMNVDGILVLFEEDTGTSPAV